jgi:hypothetical protein
MSFIKYKVKTAIKYGLVVEEVGDIFTVAPMTCGDYKPTKLEWRMQGMESLVFENKTVQKMEKEAIICQKVF